jgi:hypothetical protein
MTPAVLNSGNPCGIFLDPPYGTNATREMRIYYQDSHTVAAEVLKWCIENGDNPDWRIALCGYQGEHDVLEEKGWSVYKWKPIGGFANIHSEEDRRQGWINKGRERIWFNVSCKNNSEIMF